MEALYSSETLVSTCKSTWCYIIDTLFSDWARHTVLDVYLLQIQNFCFKVNRAAGTLFCFVFRKIFTIAEHPSAHNIIASVRHAWLDECAVSALRKKLELVSDA
jgi:hypothetical protein